MPSRRRRERIHQVNAHRRTRSVEEILAGCGLTPD
jgi:hypothetical protein